MFATLPYSLTMQYFNQSLNPGGTVSTPITVASAATISLALITLVDAAGNPIPSTIALILGTPSTADNTKCTPTSTQNSGVSALDAVSSSVTPGNYCVAASDNGSLSTTVAFAIRITMVTGTQTTTPTPTTETFASFLQPGASATHSLIVGAAKSTLSATLTSTGGPLLVLRLTVGAWDGVTCRPLSIVNTAPGASPQVALQVDPGYYCVGVKDVGNIASDHITFSVSIGHS